MIKSKKFHSDIYKQDFSIVLFDSPGEVEEDYNFSMEGCWGATEFTPGGICIIFYNIKSSLGVLAHECNHATSLLWEDRGIQKIQGVDECYDYMAAWLFDKCYEFVSAKDPAENLSGIDLNFVSHDTY